MLPLYSSFPPGCVRQLPEGCVGVVLAPSAPDAAASADERTWCSTATFRSLMYWNHDTQPLATDWQARALDWLVLADQASWGWGYREWGGGPYPWGEAPTPKKGWLRGHKSTESRVFSVDVVSASFPCNFRPLCLLARTGAGACERAGSGAGTGAQLMASGPCRTAFALSPVFNVPIHTAAVGKPGGAIRAATDQRAAGASLRPTRAWLRGPGRQISTGMMGALQDPNTAQSAH
jgi:hypothetical protein